MFPKGTLYIVGGAMNLGENTVDKDFRLKILKDMLSKNVGGPVEIVIAGSPYYKEIKIDYNRAFKRLKYNNFSFIVIKQNADGMAQQYLDRVRNAGVVFFVGGDQTKIMRNLNDTEFLDIIEHRYKTDSQFIIGGTSAGAMIMSSVMIKNGGLKEALTLNDLKMGEGFGLLPHCIVDTHFIKRGRFSRLAHAVALHPKKLGIGLSEDTALVITRSHAECLGSGMVVLIDGTNIIYMNVKKNKLKMNEPLGVRNLAVHFLVDGCNITINNKMHSRKKDD